MTLTEMETQILSMIEEVNENNPDLTDDPDIQAKIFYVINQIQNELSRIKKITAYEIYEVTSIDDVYSLPDKLSNFYQLNKILGVKYNIIDDKVIWEETGTAKIFYYKYPEQITSETDVDSYKFELSQDVLEILPYGVAGDLLKSDPSTNYGQIYSNRYEQMKQQLDPRPHTGFIYINDEECLNEFL